MLKINLLPQEKGRRAAASSSSVASMLIVGVVGSLVLLVGGLFLFHASQQHEVDEIREANTRTQAEIDSIKSRVSDHQKILDELAEIRRREEAIEGLQAARTGPTSMLVEVSHILSPGGYPTADPAVVERIRQMPNGRDLLWNPNWESKRLWLTGFEEDNRNVKFVGEGRSPEDVSEFMRRLQFSLYFQNVRLDRTEEAPTLSPQGNGLKVQKFVITARARY